MITTNIFVTGATGFLGGHLALTLARRGYRVRALVRRLPGAGELRDAPNIELVRGDLTN